MTDHPLYPHTVTEGERLRLCCNTCGLTVSTPFYSVPTDMPDGRFIVRALIQCPECQELAQAQLGLIRS